MKIYFWYFGLFLLSYFSQITRCDAQEINIDLNSSKILEVTSSTQGMLLSRMSHDEIINITNPAEALQIYCYDHGQRHYYNSVEWISDGSLGLLSTELPPDTSNTIPAPFFSRFKNSQGVSIWRPSYTFFQANMNSPSSEGGMIEINSTFGNGRITEVSAFIDYNNNTSGIPPNYTYNPGLEYFVSFNYDGVVTIKLHDTNSELILNKPVRLFIKYKQ